MYRNYDHVYCPSCGSRNLRIIEERNNESYNLPSGILGAICFGPIGMLCGLCCACLLYTSSAPHGELVLPHELVDDAPDAVVAGHIREVAQVVVALGRHDDGDALGSFPHSGFPPSFQYSTK